MDAQERAVVAMKEQLYHTGLVADELSSGDFPIVRDADTIRDLCLGQFFLSPPDHGDFRDGIDAVREENCVGVVGVAKGVAGRMAALLHGCGGQGWETDYVANSINMGNRRLEMLVHDHAASWIRCEADGFQVQVLRCADPADSIHERRGGDRWSVCQGDRDLSI